MYCPDCGTDNQRGQKFCTRCGSNLIALDRAREIVSEMTAGTSTTQLEASTILKIIAMVSVFGFLLITGGAIGIIGILVANHVAEYIPAPIVLGLAGYTAIILICMRLLNLLSASVKVESKRAAPPAVYATPPALPHETDRRLAEGTSVYHSVTEQTTRQFEGEARTK